MNCSFCHGHSRAPRRMTAQEFAVILAKLTGQTQYIYYHLMGEPLTHPQLPEFIQMAGAQGYKSIVTTNGTLLEKRGEELLAAGVHKVNISVHSFEEGDADAHAAYIRAIAAFAKKAAEQGVIAVLRLWNEGCDDGMNDKTLALLRLLQEAIPGEWKNNTRGIRLRESPFTTVQIHREILKAQGTCGNIGVKKSTPQKGKAPFCKKLRRREECV